MPIRTEAEAIAYRAKIVADEKAATDVEYCGGMRTEREESDKVGQDWITYYVGDTVVRRDYVPADPSVPNGTVDNPYIFTEGMKMKQNAFYTQDGSVKKVWMGEQFAVCESWEDERLAVM